MLVAVPTAVAGAPVSEVGSAVDVFVATGAALTLAAGSAVGSMAAAVPGGAGAEAVTVTVTVTVAVTCAPQRASIRVNAMLVDDFVADDPATVDAIEPRATHGAVDELRVCGVTDLRDVAEYAAVAELDAVDLEGRR